MGYSSKWSGFSAGWLTVLSILAENFHISFNLISANITVLYEASYLQCSVAQEPMDLFSIYNNRCAEYVYVCLFILEWQWWTVIPVAF